MQKFVVLPLALGVMLLCCLLPSVAADDQNPSLSIEKIVICRGVEKRMPLGIGNVFASDAGKLFCFTKVVGADHDTQITHRWFLNGDLKSSVDLPVKSGGWRTWSAKQIDPPDVGDWMVEVVAEDGAVLATIIFFVQ